MKYLQQLRYLLIVSLLLLLFTACNNVPEQGTRNQATAGHQKENHTKKKKRELRYLFFANGGIVGYFDDGTVTGCPRCDFCRSNIMAMFDDKPFGTYTIEPDGSLLVNGNDRRVPEYHKADPDGWALIDYKWHIKPPQE